MSFAPWRAQDRRALQSPVLCPFILPSSPLVSVWLILSTLPSLLLWGVATHVGLRGPEQVPSETPA